MIHHHCKSLRSFCFNFTPYGVSCDKDDSVLYTDIREVSMEIFYPNHFLSFTTDHCMTIRTLDLSFCVGDDDPDQVHELQDGWGMLRDACKFW